MKIKHTIIAAVVGFAFIISGLSLGQYYQWPCRSQPPITQNKQSCFTITPANALVGSYFFFNFFDNVKSS